MLTMLHSPAEVRAAGLALPEQVLPIYQYAAATNPHTVIVSDRDARPIGTAFEAIRAYKAGLPSLENRVYYKRISKRITSDMLLNHVREPLDSLPQDAPGSRLMVIDDYVSNSAGTMLMFNGICRKLGVRTPVDWVTMSGKGTAFNVFPYAGPSAMAPWRDRPEILGIDYEGIKLVETPTELSQIFYSAIHEGVAAMFDNMA